MAIPDKVAAAHKINDMLNAVVHHGGLKLKYRITVDPPLAEDRDWEKPEILVDFSGPDSSLLLARGGELLRALELLALESLRLTGDEHEKISFDCMNQRAMRLDDGLSHVPHILTLIRILRKCDAQPVQFQIAQPGG